MCQMCSGDRRRSKRPDARSQVQYTLSEVVLNYSYHHRYQHMLRLERHYTLSRLSRHFLSIVVLSDCLV